MTSQILLSMVFGFGIITVATVALMNTAGLRLFDLEALGKEEGRKLAFAYRYDSKLAASLRVWFARMPLFLGLGAVVAVLSTYGLYVDSTESTSMGALAWRIMAGYVLVLVLVTAVFSAVLYKAIGIFTTAPFPSTSSR